jgi:hypothetical protein
LSPASEDLKLYEFVNSIGEPVMAQNDVERAKLAEQAERYEDMAQVFCHCSEGRAVCSWKKMVLGNLVAAAVTPT